ncbi:hypothetical protein FQZ97_580170 [compost metagenome]
MLPGGAQAAQLTAGARLWLDAQVRFAQVVAQTLAQALRGEFLLHQKGCPLRLGGGQLMPPEIGEQGVEQLTVVMGQLVVEVATGLEGRVLQGALEETVDGEDRRLVETMHRQQQAPVAGRIRVSGMQAIEQLVVSRAVVVDRQQLGQALANPLAQFRRRSRGEGHHQYLRHRQLLLQQQTGVEGGEGPGLAGAGAGFDQRTAGE